jgi:hypothetical protein
MCAEGKTLNEIETKAIGDIDTRPPQSVADNARRALEVRARKPESERGMTAVGIARARDLMNRVRHSEDTIRRMASYFERHEVDKQGSTWDEQGKGWQAWYGWGGDDGFAWAKRKIEEFDRERERNAERKKKCACSCRRGSISAAEMERKDCGTGAGGFQEGNTCGGEDGSGGDESDSSGSTSSAEAALEWSGVKDAAEDLDASERAIYMVDGVTSNHDIFKADDLADRNTLRSNSNDRETADANFYSQIGDKYINGLLRGDSIQSIAESALYGSDFEQVTSEEEVSSSVVKRLENVSLIARAMKGKETDARIIEAKEMLSRFDDPDEDPSSIMGDVMEKISPVIEEHTNRLIEATKKPLREDGASVNVVRGIDLSSDIGSSFQSEIWSAVTDSEVEDIEMSGMISTTTSMRVAERFAVNDTVESEAETQSVILKIRAKNGMSLVGDASKYEESEVLLPPGKFKIVERDVIQNEGGNSKVGILVLEQL